MAAAAYGNDFILNFTEDDDICCSIFSVAFRNLFLWLINPEHLNFTAARSLRHAAVTIDIPNAVGACHVLLCLF